MFILFHISFHLHNAHMNLIIVRKFTGTSIDSNPSTPPLINTYHETNSAKYDNKKEEQLRELRGTLKLKLSV